MSSNDEPEIHPSVQPKPEDYPFDLEEALSSVVALRSRMPGDALTAATLGTERAGHGVLIGEEGLVVTIGYLVTEAESVWLVSNAGAAAPGHVVGFDQETGFGLVQAHGRLGVPALELGDSSALDVGDPVILAGQGGPTRSVAQKVVSKREFAGYWEYVLDEGIFTAPPHPYWGGGGAIGPDGRLIGIGSLFVQQALPEDTPFHGNLIVPINLLKPIKDELLMYGRLQKPARPWLGLIMTEVQSALVVANLIERGPAVHSGLQVGDVVVGVGGSRVESLADMFRRIWKVGPAGTEIPLTVVRDGELATIEVPSVSRYDLLKSPSLH